MGFIAAADPVSKQAYVFTNTGQLNDAIKQRGYIPIRADNTAYTVQEFEGGYLLDGVPLNVYIESRWFEGQMEALAPYWEAGTIPTPSTAILSVGTVAMPEDVAANYEQFKTSQSLFGGISTPVLVGGAVLAYFLLKK